jgi:hypothetical protein
MGKSLPNAEMDAALAYVAASDLLTICTSEPTTYAQATDHVDAGGYCLASIAMTPGDGNGDYAIADDAASPYGRKLTVAAQAAVPILHSGTALHIALTLAAGTTLRAVTTCTSQALVAGGTVDVPAFKIQIGDPT